PAAPAGLPRDGDLPRAARVGGGLPRVPDDRDAERLEERRRADRPADALPEPRPPGGDHAGDPRGRRGRRCAERLARRNSAPPARFRAVSGSATLPPASALGGFVHAAVQAFRYVNIAAYIALAAVALVQWRRRRDRAGMWAAAAFGSLGLLEILGFIPNHPGNLAERAIGRIDIALLVVFPFLLF